MGGWGANYLLQASDEQGAVAALAVKAKRVGKDLHLLFDGAPSAQVVLIGYHEVASENHTPLLGRMPEGSLRGYVVMAASAAGLDTSALPEGGELAELSLFDDSHQNAGALTALAPLTAGPGAVVAALGGLAAAAGGGGGGAGANPPARTPEEALKLLQAAASNNTAKGLTASVDQSAGVTGVSDANLAAINDVLNTQDVTDTRLPSKAEVQRIVDAYAKVFKAADHIDGNMTDSTAPTAEDYSMLTVSWGLTTQSSALVKMLSDVVDGKGPSDVDTVAKLQALADAVKAVMGYTTRGVDAPTVAQISSLLAGQTDPVAVTDDALTAVQKILVNNTDSNGTIASQSELLGIVKGAMGGYTTSLARIIKFAQFQLPDPDGFPTLADYATVGVGGVSESNRSALKSNRSALKNALATDTVDGTVVSTLARLQKVIDAYNAILAEANGPAPDADPSHKPTATQYTAIGTDFGATIGPRELALLNDAVGAQVSTGVDTVAEINNLARITKAIQTLAAGKTPSTPLTVADLHQLGLDTAGLSDNNADQRATLFKAIAAKADDGSETDSLSKLQAIIQAVLTHSVSPVVLDLNGDGTLSYTQQLMDVTGDRQAEYTAWAAAQDGVLVRDADGDGRLIRPSEFAFARSSKETDLQSLAAQYDSNRWPLEYRGGRLRAVQGLARRQRQWRERCRRIAQPVGAGHHLDRSAQRWRARPARAWRARDGPNAGHAQRWFAHGGGRCGICAQARTDPKLAHRRCATAWI